MKKSSKIWLAISGILLIVLGIMCFCYPGDALFATAWMIGCATLISGISKMVFTFRTQAFIPNSGTRMLSALMLIILGIVFLSHNILVAVSLPIVFAFWLLFEGIVIAVQSFDYKKFGFQYWWVLLLLGIVVAVFGCFALRNLSVSATTLTVMIGIGLIVIGVAYLFALYGVKRFEKAVNQAINK
jgi:uncharacterized membrane protein HdeD (DUF308 family)